MLLRTSKRQRRRSRGCRHRRRRLWRWPTHRPRPTTRSPAWCATSHRRFEPRSSRRWVLPQELSRALNRESADRPDNIAPVVSATVAPAAAQKYHLCRAAKPCGLVPTGAATNCGVVAVSTTGAGGGEGLGVTRANPNFCVTACVSPATTFTVAVIGVYCGCRSVMRWRPGIAQIGPGIGVTPTGLPSISTLAPGRGTRSSPVRAWTSAPPPTAALQRRFRARRRVPGPRTGRMLRRLPRADQDPDPLVRC